jgi:hypothetical protein
MEILGQVRLTLEEERWKWRQKAKEVGKSRRLKTARDIARLHARCKRKREAEAKYQQPGANGCKRPKTTAKPKNNSHR